MPLYNYQVYDSSGRKKSGFIEAQNEREAKEKLRDQGMMVASVSVKKSASSRQNIKGENLLAFTLLLSQMLNAGVPLFQSLVAIEEQYRDEPFHRVILSLCDQIKSGMPLSDALANYPDSFDKLYCSMVRAGESVGALNVVLDKLSLLLTKQMKLRREIITAMIYPAILGSFSLLIIAMLLGFVVPSIEGIFADRQLNNFTRFVLSASHWFRNWWWLYMPAVGGLIAYLVIKIRSESGKRWIERNFLKVPLIRTLMVQASLARFCRTMGTLQQGGLTMIDSLRISRDVMKNVVLEGEIQNAENKIIEGSSLSAELTKSKWIPAMVSRMLAVGEESGSTSVMLNKIAEMYEDELEKTLARVMALAQPVILILMGTVIGIVLMAILLPLTDVSSLSM
jgi:general secretion pathway protein F/type IV pilus assembly protein PilC